MSPATFRNILNHPANQGRQVYAALRYLAWQVSKRCFVAHWDIPYHGLKLRCHGDSHSASAAIYFNGLADYREMVFIRRYLRPGDAFLDVGANVGVYTLLAASLVGKSGVVHAFEPGILASARLDENIALNQLANVTVHRFGLSDRQGSAAFSAEGDDCVASLIPGGAIATAGNVLQVQCVRLDDYLPSLKWAMAKIDIEGAEPLAIRGVITHLAAGNPPVLQIEMDGYSRRFGVETHDFIAELASLGYDVGIFDDATNQIEFTTTPWERGVLNVLAVNRSRRAEVQARLLASKQ